MKLYNESNYTMNHLLLKLYGNSPKIIKENGLFTYMHSKMKKEKKWNFFKTHAQSHSTNCNSTNCNSK